MMAFIIKTLIFDIYALLTKNLNSFSVEAKLQEKNQQEMIYILQDKCIPVDFYKYIC